MDKIKWVGSIALTVFITCISTSWILSAKTAKAESHRKTNSTDITRIEDNFKQYKKDNKDFCKELLDNQQKMLTKCSVMSSDIRWLKQAISSDMTNGEDFAKIK